MLYQGDNLTILKSIETASIDLIYIDPPFNKGKTFTAKAGSFEDKFKSKQDYLEFLKVRLLECKRVMKDTASIYIHLDPSISHYVKVLMDGIFNESNFRNEIVWCYSGGGIPVKDFPKKHNNILRYSKTSDYIFNADSVRVPYFSNYKSTTFRRPDSRKPGGEYFRNPNGKVVEDWWSDIDSRGKEWTDYPTQKPLALLERIIKASSNEGDIVLDAFCGSGTTCVAAKNLGRQWIGIDSNPEAIAIAKSRLSPEGTML